MTDIKRPKQMEMEDLFREIEGDSANIVLELFECRTIDGLREESDNISPAHYKLSSGLEVRDIMKDVMGIENVKQFYKGNIIKYILRADKKNGLEDYKKAKRYIEMLEELEELESV